MTNAKLITLSIIIFLLFSCFTIKTAFTNATAATSNLNLVNTVPLGAIIVPDDYPTIQAAIGNASAEDTIFVKKGIYYCGLGKDLVINKSLTLIGEDANATIINGRYESYNFRPAGYNTISIEASNVLITGFTMTNCENAIAINPRNFGKSTDITIDGNIFIDNHRAVTDDGHFHDAAVNIFENAIKNCEVGLYVSANNTVISGNIITDNSAAIAVNKALNITLSGNLIASNSLGIVLSEVSGVSIFENDISGIGHDSRGIEFGANCNYTLVHNNNISGNSLGINVQNVLFVAGSPGVEVPQGLGNIVYQNNLFDNAQNANVEHRYPYNVTNVVNGTTIVSWDNYSVGNYWGDYQSKYPNASEIDASGIGNTPYGIDENNTDHYPLIQRVNITIEVPTSTPSIETPVVINIIIASVIVLLVIATVVIVLIKRQKKRT